MGQEGQVQFQILGPLRISTPTGAQVVVRSRHERTVLGILLMRAGHAVSADQLVEALWPHRPPASYVSNLQTYVSRLRERLPGVTIEHASGCYRIVLDPQSLDAAVFRREVATGRAALDGGDAAEAVARLRRAVALWRGRPLADLSVAALDPEIAQLEAERLTAVEDRIDAELAAGGSSDGGDVLADLHRLVAEYPLRERLYGQLMVALCRAGQRVDALGAYQRARQLLVDELGIEPGPQLRRIHREILSGQEPSTALRGGAFAAPAPRVFPVCQLPPPVAGFVGRARTVARAAGLVAPDPVAVPVVVVSGQPGVGKSALAVLVAHQVRAEFPDGQLFAHLAGACDTRRDLAAVIADLLRALGVAGSAMPQDLAALSGAYRARLADRRVLVVLDDAADPGQVRALTPGTPGSAVLVTSRSRLSGLTDAAHLPLGPLTDAEAGHLLARVAGLDGGAGHGAARITAACGNLPLALRIAGTRLATRGLGVDVLADRLDDHRRRLTELAISDQQVRASLGLSVQAISAEAREAFGLLGLLGPVAAPSWAVAALIGGRDADAVVDELVEASLLDPMAPDPSGEMRFRMHDLLRVYAVELLSGRPSGDAVAAAALDRMLTAATALTLAATELLPRTLTWSHPVPAPAVPALPAAGGVPPGTGLTRDPAGWLAAQRPFLVAAIVAAATAGVDRQAVLLAERLAPALWIGGHWIDLDRVQVLARRAAVRLGDERSELLMTYLCGVLRLVRGDLDGAGASFATARRGFERLGDRRGLACVLGDQAVLEDYHDRAGVAVATARHAVELFRADGDQLGAILASPGLSAALRGLGRLGDALEVDLAAVATATEIGAPPLVLARCLNALAVTRLLADDPAGAYLAARDAARLLRATSDRYVLLAALRHMALAAVRLGRRRDAVGLLERSHGLAVELGDRVWATGLERDLAASWIGDGRVEEAIAVLLRCLRTFREMRLRSGQAATLGLLAVAYRAAGRPRAAAAARSGAVRLADPTDARSPVVTGIVLRLTVPPEVADPAPAVAQVVGQARTHPVVAGRSRWSVPVLSDRETVIPG
jgi:DNA-binding SARP family transcriptional activator